MKKKRKNKQMRFDEFYSNGFFELGRMGNIVSLKNNFTEQDILERNTELAQQYDEKKAEVMIVFKSGSLHSSESVIPALGQEKAYITETGYEYVMHSGIIM